MATGKGPLRIAIEDFIKGLKVGENVHGWINEAGEKLRSGSFGEAWHVIMDELGADADVPPIVSNHSPAAVLGLPALIPMLIGALVGMGFAFMQTIIQPVAMRVVYKVNHKWGAYRISPPQAAQLLKLWPEKSSDWLNMLQDLGVDENNLNGLQALNRQYLQSLQYIALWRRQTISDIELNNKLKQLGMLDTDIDRLKTLTDIIPTPNDLITMQVREAFNEEFSQRFRHDEGDITEVTKWAEKQGLSAEWVKRYWRAHWQLPSPNQVFEMLHRLRPGTTENTITADDVDGYLKAADYSPFWRDRLKEISYAPYTRVDVRRMYKTGALNENEVKQAYLDLGYDDKHAQALTEFTIAYEAEEETGIVRSSVLSAYGDGQIDRTTAEGMLKGGGYDNTTVAFYLDNVDFKESLEVQNIKLQAVHKKFVEGLIDETNVHGAVNALNLPAERITALLELWLTERENQTALLSVSQMETLLERGIVSPDDFKRIVKRLGYTDESINWTMLRIAQEAAEKAQKDAEKLATDNERIQKSKTASLYQKNKSEIDLGISQAHAEITDIDVALHGEITDADIETLKARKDELKQFIASLNVSKAQLRFDTRSTLDKMAGTNE